MLNMMSNENVGSPLAKNRNSGYIEPSAETKNSRPAMMSDFLRPRLVASRPEKAGLQTLLRTRDDGGIVTEKQSTEYCHENDGDEVALATVVLILSHCCYCCLVCTFFRYFDGDGGLVCLKGRESVASFLLAHGRGLRLFRLQKYNFLLKTMSSGVTYFSSYVIKCENRGGQGWRQFWVPSSRFQVQEAEYCPNSP